MINKKNTGSYYTPDYLSEFVLKYVSPRFSNIARLHILEPSVGDGSFVKAFNKTCFPNTVTAFSFTAIDKIKPELEKARLAAIQTKKNNTRYSFTKADFLKFIPPKKKFHLIIGNPPYIKKGLLNKTQINLCKEIHKLVNLSESTVKNIWPAFLIRCSQSLQPNGILALVLPSELLQVKFSTQLRTFLTEQFQRVEIFTFDNLLFDCKGQDTVLLVGFKSHTQQGQFYTKIVNAESLTNNSFVLTQNLGLTATDTKWSHHTLNSDELTFIHNIGKQLQNVNHYCNSKPGIVTAANNFFIINENVEESYSLQEYTRPIIQKGLFVNGSIIFDQEDYRNLADSGKPVRILCFNDENANSLPDYVQEYLQIGVERELPSRYKCKKRENWFVIPNISTIPQGFFFKRCHHYPKLLKNNSNALVTDSAYKIEMKNGYNIDHFIYSFYNSLTLTFAELNGRYYGGGVLELTPNEFKSLPIPNIAIEVKEFVSYIKHFENKAEIYEVLNKNDFSILNQSLNLNAEEILRIKSIYQKLIDKRLRKKV